MPPIMVSAPTSTAANRAAKLREMLLVTLAEIRYWISPATSWSNSSSMVSLAQAQYRPVTDAIVWSRAPFFSLSRSLVAAGTWSACSDWMIPS